MISGQQALFEIEQATAAIRIQESDCANQLLATDQELARLRATRGELLRKLASARLDAMRSEQIAGEIASAEQRALRMIAESRATLESLSARIGAAQTARAEAETERREKAGEVARILGRLEELQAGVEPKVRGSAEWIAQKERVDRAQHVFEASDAKATQAETDRAAKGKPYEDDPLFMYLWSRGFGAAQYRSGFLVRFFDEKVARLIGFHAARPNYAMLKEIPLRLRAHAERCRAELAAERQKLADIEKAGLEAAGAGAFEEELRAARTALAAADDRLKAADAALRTLDAERDKALNEEVQATTARAVDILSNADSNESIRELYRKAAMTRAIEDDVAVQDIEANDRSLAASERQRADLIGKARQLAQRRSDIEAERAKFYRRGYDNPMGQFDNENAIADALGAILKGVVQGAVLGTVLQGGYNERQRRADSGFGGDRGFNFPGAEGGGSGGGWIGGDSGGGDGFRTGGGF
ncbi:conserved hypothetical protein [Methylocella tundrae]|uniref:Uncharacterized protein n=1 Tax=Methylocella tundrae TaxID=227605 RepID=A0A8B6M7T0_METTU|nr:hypothetical protein [Methylocella tundrae]VTZ50363.1 conserved hypothetical protein [Methylocella tundrae]